MKIGIVGAGSIGGTLALKLSAAGHEVTVSNARGPDSIAPDLLQHGARAGTVDAALREAAVVILSIPMENIRDIAPAFANLGKDVTVIDTSNFMPYRSGKIPAVEAGQVEGEWVAERLGRPVVKAWNSIFSGSLAAKGRPAGAPDRVALPVAGDRETDRTIARALVEDSGFDAVDAGPLADAWRQQPGAPAYCTDLTRDELIPALAAAERERLPRRRDLAQAIIMERVGDGLTGIDMDWVVRLLRAIYL